ncbi:MAG: hypothetical protein NUW14_13150, partial [Deltaproteobacteria bacterium]|nr:hypothetical protein [Deltaproteobacteria bacterium]
MGGEWGLTHVAGEICSIPISYGCEVDYLLKSCLKVLLDPLLFDLIPLCLLIQAFSRFVPQIGFGLDPLMPMIFL